MRKKIFMLCACFVLGATGLKAQWVVADPGNLAQGIINATKNIVHTSSTASNMLNNFREVQKVYNQGKEYYDALKAVNDLVRDARKVQKTILMVGEITEIYVRSFEKMLGDDNFSVEELSAIANGYARLLGESNDVLQELRGVVNASSMSLSDKERMEVVDATYNKMLEFRNLVKYFTNKNISVSLLRGKEKNSAQRVLDLYGGDDEKYW